MKAAMEMLDRMEALVRKMAGDQGHHVSANNHGTHVNSAYIEARAIVAELPAPVDPLLVEAREIAMETLVALDKAIGRPNDTTEWRRAIATGSEDLHPVIQSTLAALRRAREEGVK